MIISLRTLYCSCFLSLPQAQRNSKVLGRRLTQTLLIISAIPPLHSPYPTLNAKAHSFCVINYTYFLECPDMWVGICLLPHNLNKWTWQKMNLRVSRLIMFPVGDKWWYENNHHTNNMRLWSSWLLLPKLVGCIRKVRNYFPSQWI